MMGWAMSGFFIGLLAALVVANEVDDARVKRGWMEQRGKIYLLVPAKLEPSP